jgi:hypothetical protein
VAIAAGVIGVEMAVRNEVDLGDPVPRGTQRLLHRPHLDRLIAVDHLARLRRKAGVEEEQAARVLDHERGDDDALAGERAVGRHRVVAGVDGLNARQRHVASD